MGSSATDMYGGLPEASDMCSEKTNLFNVTQTEAMVGKKIHHKQMRY